jgi:hypothetical protein
MADPSLVELKESKTEVLALSNPIPGKNLLMIIRYSWLKQRPFGKLWRVVSLGTG